MKISTQKREHSPNEVPEDSVILTQQEQLVYECLKRTHSATSPNDSLNYLLAFIGEQFGCKRTYIFEQNVAGRYDNTYEWCAPGVTSEKKRLQDEEASGMDWWFETFRQGRELVIQDVEDIRDDHPIAYAVLVAQDIRSLVVAGLWDNDHHIGFFGADDPQPDKLEQISVFLRLVGYFVSSILRRRDLMARLEYLSYHDQLTGIWNLSSMREQTEQLEKADSIGIVYCDITNLKQVNDNLGHNAGDETIKSCARSMIEVFGKERSYRIGGDEFIAICPDIEQENFQVLVKLLKVRIEDGDRPIAVGTAWTDRKPLDLSSMIAQAEVDMYENKRAYYTQIDPSTGKSRDRRRSARPSTGSPAQNEDHLPNTSLARYVRGNYFNGEALLQSVGESGSSCFLYFGDMQTGIFYVTDNLRDTFGFEDNLVPDFINAWQKRISNQEDLKLFQQDMLQLWLEKKDRHDLQYRVKDQKGNDFWIHCRGLIQWDAERKEPLFFSGCIVRQEPDFVVDPVTNFLRESAALTKLDELKQNDGLSIVVGFCLDHFSEINESRGRDFGDDLLHEVANQLNEHFGHRVFFYRLDGLYFLAVATSAFHDEDLGLSIQEIVQKCYWERGVIVRRACSIGVLRKSDMEGEATPQSILVTAMHLASLAKDLRTGEEQIDTSDVMQRKKEQAELLLELDRSVINNFAGFRIVVQPIVYKNGDIVGGEALLRWNYRGKDVPPGQFIPLLEKNRLILPVGRWVFKEAVRTCKRIITSQLNFRISFNVSYHQLADEGFIDFMRKTLDEFDLDGSHLVMELTETRFDETPEKFQHFVSSCTDMGMRVALDDFGSGYSTSAMLMRAPGDIVKLDRSLLAEFDFSMDKSLFLRTVVYACHQFGKLVCMEGVETEDDLAVAREAQCDMFQGFYFYKPLELKDLYSLLLVR